MQADLPKSQQDTSSPVYSVQWDKFYASLSACSGQKALWDVSADLAAMLDFSVFSPFINNELPMLDFGCGTGTQSAYLKKHWHKVIGIDVSGKAIEMADAQYAEPGLSFMTIDNNHSEYFYHLHRDTGDMHIYMRGVLHQIKEEEISDFIASIKILMGSKGKLYFTEVASSILDYFKNGSDNFSQLPRIMQQTFISHLPPRGLSLKNLPLIFPSTEFNILTSGKTKLYTNICFKNNEPIHIPAIYAVVECRQFT